MPSCCVPGCRSRTPGQEPGVTFHTFPKDPERRRQWTEAVRPGQRDWEPAKRTCVCSKHFLPEHFDRMSPLVVRIRADAVPLQQEPLSQQPADGTAVAATAQHGAQQALTQSHTSPASPLQQAPMDVAESQETLAGPSQPT
ncbi:THAP domain-containing protein 2-like [Amblyomma americanum]